MDESKRRFFGKNVGQKIRQFRKRLNTEAQRARRKMVVDAQRHAPNPLTFSNLKSQISNLLSLPPHF
jgi:hypothetical protein